MKVGVGVKIGVSVKAGADVKIGVAVKRGLVVKMSVGVERGIRVASGLAHPTNTNALRINMKGQHLIVRMASIIMKSPLGLSGTIL